MCPGRPEASERMGVHARGARRQAHTTPATSATTVAAMKADQCHVHHAAHATALDQLLEAVNLP